MASEVLDLKKPNNHKNNTDNEMNDVLDSIFNGTENSSQEIEQSENIKENPVEKNYYQEYEDTDPADKLFEQNPAGFDNSEVFQNNAGNMDELATLTSANYSWTSPDKHHELISHAWRKAVIVILVAMAFLSLFWQGSVLTAVTFFALALVTSMHFWREVQYHRYEIHPHGIVVNDTFYHYHDLDSFWIHYHPEGYHELSLCTGKLLNHYVKIPLRGQDPFEIRDALSLHLPEERHEEGVEDWLRRRLGL